MLHVAQQSAYPLPMKRITKKAIRAAGGPAELGRKLGISWQAVSKWDKVPPLRVLAVERASGVPRYELRPDIYGRK